MNCSTQISLVPSGRAWTGSKSLKDLKPDRKTEIDTSNMDIQDIGAYFFTMNHFILVFPIFAFQTPPISSCSGRAVRNTTP